MFTQTKLKDVDTIICQCVCTRTADENDGAFVSPCKNSARNKDKQGKKGNCKVLHANAKRFLLSYLQLAKLESLPCSE